MGVTPYELAKKELGTLEWAKGSNPKVLAYYRDAGHAEIVSDDVAWCAAFVGAMIKRAGGKPTGSLAARSYLDWGIAVDPKDIREGDILVFKRGNSTWQGHVTFAASKPSGGYIKCLGGNQSDQVNIQKYALGDQFLGARRWPGVVEAVKPVATPKPVSTPSSTPPSKSFWAAVFAAIGKLFGVK